MCGFLLFTLPVPQTKSPHDLSNSFWHELSSPSTESSDENFGETTTHVHEPFFEENSTQINVTTQLGSDVYLHCRVNDLREKMVSKVGKLGKCLHFPSKVFARNWFRKSENEKSLQRAVNTLKFVVLTETHQLNVESFRSFPSQKSLFFSEKVLFHQIQSTRKLLKYQNKYRSQLLR